MARQVRIAPVAGAKIDKELRDLAEGVAKPTRVELLKAFKAAILHFEFDSEAQAVHDAILGKKLNGQELTVTLIGKAESEEKETKLRNAKSLLSALDQIFVPEKIWDTHANVSTGPLRFGMSAKEAEKAAGSKLKIEKWNSSAAARLGLVKLRESTLEDWSLAWMPTPRGEKIERALKTAAEMHLNEKAVREIKEVAQGAGVGFLFDSSDALAAVAFVMSDVGPKLRDHTLLGLSRSQFQETFPEDEVLSEEYHGAIAPDDRLWVGFIDNLGAGLAQSSRSSCVLVYSSAFQERFFSAKMQSGAEKPRFDWFWSLIQVNPSDNKKTRLASIKKSLAPLSKGDLLIFRDHMFFLVSQAYSPIVDGFARVTNQGASNDSYDDFCHWLISKGRKFYEAALKKPDSLADQNVERDIDGSDLVDIVATLYQKKIDGDPQIEQKAKAQNLPESVIIEDAFELDDSPMAFDFPVVQDVKRKWSDKDLKEAFPKLYAKFQ